MSLNVYLGIDVGSVTTKLALVDEKGKYVDSYMLKTAGKPVDAVQDDLVPVVLVAFVMDADEDVGPDVPQIVVVCGLPVVESYNEVREEHVRSIVIITKDRQELLVSGHTCHDLAEGVCGGCFA